MAQPGPIVFTRLWARDPSTSISSQPQSSSLAALLGAISTTQIRGPVFTRLWTTDPGAAINSQPQSSPTVLISVVQAQPPFNYDWPVPRGYLQGVSNLWSLWGTPAGLLALSGIPSSFQFDWPNPKGPAVSLLWYGAGTPLALLSPVNIPVIAQYDWPVPMGYVSSVYLRWAGQGTPSSFIPATGTPVSKSFSYDWPNPRGPVGNVVLRTISTDGINPNLFPPVPPAPVVALHAPHFFSTMGMCIGAPANPPS